MRSSPSARPDPARTGWLCAQDVAHRGLHGPGVPENSLAAADAAIAAGLAIECDVRLATDGAVLVFHDADCARLCGVPGAVADADRARLRLLGTAERVPTLPDLLARVAGRVPLLVEVKAERGRERLCRAVRDALRGYTGPAAVMSFDPRVPRWFARHVPGRMRGLVVTERPRPGDALRRRLAGALARPDFVAYDVRALPSAWPRALRRRGVPVLAWTVRTPAEHAVAAAHADRPILEQA